jgi:hypothetical protein
MNNFDRCIAYGIGIEADSISAAKNYRLSAEFKNAGGANNCGIYFEREIEVGRILHLQLNTIGDRRSTGTRT